MSTFAQQGLALSYRTFGKGSGTIIAFHGFGRTGEDFRVFEQYLGDDFTIHAFDLPFHGESPAPSERAEQPFAPDELRDFFTAFADRICAKRIVLMGFSLGGRVALSLLATMPERIGQAVLIAPDGLKTEPWYRALASSAWGRARYRHFIDRPQRVHTVVNTLHRIGLLGNKMHRFVTGQTDSRDKRRLVHDVWLSFRHIEPDLAVVAKKVREHALPVTLIFGAKDSVIKPALASRLQPGTPGSVTTIIVDAGHQLLTAELGDRLRAVLVS